MKPAFQPQYLWFFTCITLSYAADILQNSDFEIPPNITTNATSLNQEDSIPGWSFNGTVWYVTSGTGNLSLPGNGHGIKLGENGKINQTFEVTDSYVLDYILTFTLAVQDDYCGSKNLAAVNISVLEPQHDRSRAFVLERNLSRNFWESYAIYIGSWGRGSERYLVNLEIKSVKSTNLEQNVSCWPVVDTIIIKKNNLPMWWIGVNGSNLLANGDFEIGPAFVNNSSKGILLNEDRKLSDTPLQKWKILGTIKYIDSQHFKVPHGEAAIQLISGPDPSGIQTEFFPIKGLAYTLNFTTGDANDSCLGFFTVFLQMGNNIIMNFTIQSNGTGSIFKHSIAPKVDETDLLSEGTTITFYSFNETKRSDGVLCGPVLDNIFLDVSYGERIQLSYGVVIFILFFLLLEFHK